MNSVESSTPQARSTPSYSDPTPNPFITISDRASRLMLIVLVSCALTVALVRLFLVLTGYPQIGNSTFHLAHALWGGLALLLAGVMALVVQNRGAAMVIALLTGIGFGLFVDEVGKFITQKNDYFFPLAAPIVYASLLLILLLTELARAPPAAQSAGPPAGGDFAEPDHRRRHCHSHRNHRDGKSHPPGPYRLIR
jgi:hypothetical protein